MARNNEDPKAKVNLDLGFGGLFKGLGDFIDLLGEMIETGQHEATRSGEFKIKGLNEKAQGVYGFSVRTGIGGAPRVERFGNIRATKEGPEVADVREPLLDIFDEGDEIVVAAELPGASEAEILVDVQDDVLSVKATGKRNYAKEVLLPAAVDKASMRKAFNNGILELRWKKA